MNGSSDNDSSFNYCDFTVWKEYFKNENCIEIPVVLHVSVLINVILTLKEILLFWLTGTETLFNNESRSARSITSSECISFLRILIMCACTTSKHKWKQNLWWFLNAIWFNVIVVQSWFSSSCLVSCCTCMFICSLWILQRCYVTVCLVKRVQETLADVQYSCIFRNNVVLLQRFSKCGACPTSGE